MKSRNIYQTAFLCASILVEQAVAAPNYQPAGTDLTNGHGMQEGDLFSGLTNPATISMQPTSEIDYFAVAPSVGFAIEYGNVDDIFETIDEIAAKFGANDGSDSGSGGTGSGDPSDEVDSLFDVAKKILNENVDLEKTLAENPGLQDALVDVAVEFAVVGALVTIMAEEAYAKADAQLDIPILLGSDSSGGHWAVGINSSFTSKVFGLADVPAFNAADAEQAVKDYLVAPDGTEPDQIDLSGGLILNVDSATGSINSGEFSNESLLLTKVAQVDEFSLNYARPVGKFDAGQLHLGTKIKYLRVGLSQVGIRFGDVTDSEKIFNDLKNAKFEHEDNFGFDLGAAWNGETYNLGLALVNINQPKFEFSGISDDGLEKENILSEIQNHKKYVMESQAKLSAGLFTVDKRWSMNMGLDANGVEDVMLDASQWANIAGAYNSAGKYFSGARVGYRQNLVGTELSYISAGLTLFNFLNLDVASSLETVEINDTTLPRSFAVNLGIAQSF
jgi:hypothetical protein